MPTHRWSHEVIDHSDALDLDKGVFKLADPRKIAAGGGGMATTFAGPLMLLGAVGLAIPVRASPPDSSTLTFLHWRVIR
jgi:hypothetical protein